MRALTLLCVGLVLAAATMAGAAELKSGVPVGDIVAPFDVVKCSGAADDGVKVGAQLCYRCKYSGNPMVITFSRSHNKKVVALTEALDKAVAEKKDAGLSAFVALVGDDREKLEKHAKTMGKANVPVVVPVEYENGPDDYSVSSEADVTVLLVGVDGRVVSSHAFAKGQLNDDAVSKIVADTANILK